MRIYPFLLFIVLLFPSSLQSQKLTIEEAVLQRFGALGPENLDQLQWVPGTDKVSWVTDKQIILGSTRGKTKPVLTLSELVQSSGMSFKSFPTIHWISPVEFYFQKDNTYHLYNTKEKNSSKWVSLPEKASNQDLHEKSGSVAYTVDNNLHLIAGRTQTAVTNHERGIVAGQVIARQEFGIKKGTFWSNNGQMLAFYEKDERGVGQYPILDETVIPTSVEMIRYPMAGTTGEVAKVGIHNVRTGNTVYIQANERRLDDSFYLTNLAWGPNDDFIYVALINRAQNQMALQQFSALTGEFVKTLFTESDEAYVEPEHPVIFIPGKSDEFLWFSERNGFNNLYHYNTAGKLLGQSNLNFPITKFVGFVDKGLTAIVEATGENPTENHAYLLTLSNMNVEKLTKQPGIHHIKLADRRNYLVDTWSSLEVPRRVDIINNSGKVGTTLLNAKNPLEGRIVGSTQLGTLPAKDGTTLYYRMITPPGFDSRQSYPVLVYVYGGPHVQLVTNRWLGGAPLWMHSLAADGYIVFTVDNRGSDNRGLEFEQAIYRQLGKLEIEDQEAGVDFLKSLPYVDTDRMAVHGWSYGGYMTTSLMLKKPDLFKVGVAGGAVIDWKYYEVMYTERYMDTPQENPKGYEETALTNYVDKLEGKLFMIHGAQDATVVMQHHMAFIKACVDKDVLVNEFIYPGHAHNVRGKDRVHLIENIVNYIKFHL